MIQKKRFLLCLVVFVLCFAGFSNAQASWQTVYVDSSNTSGNYTGATWENAFRTIDEALNYSFHMGYVTIKIAQGTYIPTEPVSGDFHIRNYGVKIIGGYPSHARDEDSANPDIYHTIISGDVDHNDTIKLAQDTCIIKGTNSRSVLKIRVYDNYFTPSIELYGLIIVGGVGGQLIDISTPGRIYDQRNGPHYLGGAGLYLETNGSCKIKKCKFISNTSDYPGGAIAFFGFNSSFIVDSSYFCNNLSLSPIDISDPRGGIVVPDTGKAGGGAIYSRSIGDVEIWNSTFKKCRASNAGGAINYHSNSRLTLGKCRFQENSSGSDGGAVYCLSGPSLPNWIVENVFLSNKAENGNGGSIFIRGKDTFIKDLADSNNTASDSGGALCIYGNNFSIEKGSFKRDSSSKGGACFLYVGYADFDSVNFTNNRSKFDGGGVFVGTEAGGFTDCTFKNNLAHQNGGAIYGGAYIGLDLTNTVLDGNVASQFGGAIYYDKGKLDCNKNTIFNNNSAAYGGGICLRSSQETLRAIIPPYCSIKNTTISGNAATVSGGAYYQNDYSDNDGTIYFSSILNNSVGSSGAVIEGYNGSITYSLIANNHADNGNIIKSESDDTKNRLDIDFSTIAGNTCSNPNSVISKANQITSSIIWNNGLTPFTTTISDPAYSIINISNPGNTNLNDDPQFIGSGKFPYSLSSLSLAINAANPSADTAGTYYDLAGRLRMHGSRMDMGAYEYNSGKIYVNEHATGNNNGSSWIDAFTNLQDAIHIVASGDTIMVAAGTYYPTSGTDQEISFSLGGASCSSDNIVILGGFAGNETSAIQRDWRTRKTILSGDIGIRGSDGDNSYHVIDLYNVSNLTIDGFSIKNGNAYGNIVEGGVVESGGGIKSTISKNITIRNCNFVHNKAFTAGSGCEIDATVGVIFENCSFEDNSVYGDNNPAGAIILSAYSDSIMIRGCSFYNNNSLVSSSAIEFINSRFNIVNSTFYKNCINLNPGYKIALADSSKGTLTNCIIWNPANFQKEIYVGPNDTVTLNHCNIKDSTIAIDTAGGHVECTNVWGNDPAFTDTINGNLQLTQNSFCIDRGTAVDTTGWGHDLTGRPRLYNRAIDLGAYEFQGSILPFPPQLLPTLSNFEIRAADTCLIDLNRKNADGSGYYVTYSSRDISELTWTATPPDTNVKIFLDPESNKLVIEVNSKYKIGSIFSVILRAADPQYPDIKAERIINFTVVSPHFEVCALSVSQNDGGKDFRGTIEAKRTIDPIFLSNSRIYLGDDVNGTIDKMQYISGVSLNEITLPRSRGGSTDCGKYEFSFNATNAFVYNANGTNTGKTLYEWAADPLSRYPGSLFYKSHNAIKFIFPVTNGIDGVALVTKVVPADFNAPLTTLKVTGVNAHRQNLSWSYNEKLAALSLYIIPEGNNPPKADTVVFDSAHLYTNSFTVDSLQDSRKYRYILHALDMHGNTGESQAIDSTPSDFYSISGRVSKFNVPVDTSVHVRLYSVNQTNSRQLLRDSLVALDSNFSFKNVQNGNYIVNVEQGKQYCSAPVEQAITVLRDSVSGILFEFMPTKVINDNAVMVEQVEGTGDLKFTVATNRLFQDEKPVRVFLKWEGGDTAVDTASQMFTVSSYTENMNADGSAKWQFTIPRSAIEDSILGRKPGFDVNVRYIDSKIETEAFGFLTFRSGFWSYPIGPDSSKILFAAQRFKKPQNPLVSKPLTSKNDATFMVWASPGGPGLQAIYELNEKFGRQSIKDSLDVGDVSAGNAQGWIVRKMDLNYAFKCSPDNKGRSFLSGLVFDSLSRDTSKIYSTGTFFTSPYSDSAGPNDTLPSATWRVKILYSKTYYLWIYVESLIKQSTTVKASIDNRPFTFTLSAGSKPGWYKSNEAHVLYEGMKVPVTFYYPQGQQVYISTFAINGTDKKMNVADNYREFALAWGTSNQKRYTSGFNLYSEATYDLKVFVKDRYGNTSDTVKIDSIITKSDYFKGNVAIHQDSGNGNLVLDIVTKDTVAAFLDSVIFRFAGADHRIPLYSPLNRGGHTEIILDRDKLGTLKDEPLFWRHTNYDSLFLVFAAEPLFTISNTYNPAVSSCTECDAKRIEAGAGSGSCSVRTTKYSTLFGYRQVTTYGCSYTVTNTYRDTVRSPRIRVKWPAGPENEVASQEYRSVTSPVLDSVEATSRYIKVACTNLNTTGTGVKEQMAGSLNIAWTPGSICSDTTFDTIPFGNRFTMQGNWIAFIPSFEGALKSNEGIWRLHDTLKTRHQWIDKIDPTDTLAGGEFYPNIGCEISKAEVFNNRTTVPSISTGIFLSELQASRDTVTPSEKFHLWVLASKVNGDSSKHFFWGIDGIPDTVNIGTASAPVWERGPDVALSQGNHTIDLFMKDDGINIAAIALSKDNVNPPDTLALYRWGNAGFDLAVNATDLPSNSDIKFICKAVDRLGNVSERKERVIRTKQFETPIPGVVISPDIPLENGIYHSIYPSFTLSLDHADSSNLTLETKLFWNHGGASDTLTQLHVISFDTAAKIWNVAVDSAAPLTEYPTSGGVSSSNGYAVKARIINDKGLAGNWTQLLFGVKPDTTEIPPTVTIRDSIYQIPSLKFRFDHGVQISSNTIVGDLELLFDFDNSSGKRLMLEGATIVTNTSTDTNGAIVHESIDTVYGGNLACYECDEYGMDCSRSQMFSFPYGKFTADAVAESLSIVSYGNIKKIRAPSLVIHDDNNNTARLSSNSAAPVPVSFCYKGIVDSCYMFEDRFFMQNVLAFGTVHPGFNIDACNVIFTRDTVNDRYKILASGCNQSSGPDLKFAVLNPNYLEDEFTVFDPLRDPLKISYTGTSPEYTIDFSSGNNAVLKSGNSAVRYNGWDLGINSYTFGPDGVTLTDFKVGLNKETFPEDKNNGSSFVERFSGSKVTGHSDVNDGALHFFGNANASGTGVTISTANEYRFKDIVTFKFRQMANNEYQLYLPNACNLSCPIENSPDFDPASPLVIGVHPDTGLVIAPDGIVKVNASGAFERYISKLRIKGNLGITYAAHDFQLKLTPNGTDSLFRLSNFFTSSSTVVDIAKASIGLFSDFTINTLYGKKEGGSKYNITPSRFNFASISSDGFDIIKTSGDGTAGIRVLLLAPTFPLGDLTSLIPKTSGDGCNLPTTSIYNAGFDLNGDLSNLSGKIDIPENMLGCLGANGLTNILKNDVASFKLKSIYLGYSDGPGDGEAKLDTFSVGADATIELEKVFNNIGLQGEKISLNKLTAGHTSGSWHLKELHASAFPLPRLISIGPDNFSKSVTKDEIGKKYVELYTGGNGFGLDYENQGLTLNLRNWSLRLTNEFPIKTLRGVSFLVDTFIYVHPANGNGKVAKLTAFGKYTPPGGVFSIGDDFAMYNASITLGSEDIPNKSNTTNVNAFLKVEFDSLKIGNKGFKTKLSGHPECQSFLKIFFDGNIEGSGCLVWKDTIGIVPWGAEQNPKIFIDPGKEMFTAFYFSTQDGSMNFDLHDVMLRSRDKLPGIDTTLAVNLASLKFSYNFKLHKFCVNTFNAQWFIYKKLFENDAFRLAVNQIDFGYTTESQTDPVFKDKNGPINLKDKFWIKTVPDFKFKLTKDCKVNATPTLGLFVNTLDLDSNQRKAQFVWDVAGTFNCTIGGLALDASFIINNDTIGFDTAFFDMKNLEQYGIISKDPDVKNMQAGVHFEDVFWIKNKDSKNWDFDPNKSLVCTPSFKLDKAFDLNVLKIKGTFNFERLFKSPYPGLGYENIRVQMPDNLGGAEVPTCMSLYLDGKKPFLHPQFDKPNKFAISFPGIKLTEDITLGEALMEIGTEKSQNADYETWYFRGMASMSLKPAVDNLTVDIAFEKPQPWENVTGIRHAKVKLMLAPSCRIPLGTTPFFIAGFEGAIYDGTGMPEAATKCYIPTLPPGLKTEAAVLLEFKEPSVVNGKLAFWMHLYKLNFGFNGEVTALEGIADAQACAALYNNGTAFHGHFLAYVHLGLAAKGRFTIDIWEDPTGANFTADALAAIGLERGSLIKTRLIKIPTKEKWFMEMFTKAGKFQDNKGGLTTGLRFFGKTWGLGIIRGKFKIGDMGKYKLKQAPVVVPGGMAKRLMLAKSLSSPAVAADCSNMVNPGFILEGGEVISLVAATDSSAYLWPGNVLRVVDAKTLNEEPNRDNYIPIEGRGTDTTKEYYSQEDNMVARVWVNNEKYDSIYVLVPDTIRPANNQPHGGFEYLFSAGLKPAKLNNFTAEPINSGDTLKVRINGTISDFQGHIRNLVRKNYDAGKLDTLLRQKMALKLYCSSIDPRPVDTILTQNYLYNFMEIPISQLDGYHTGDTSLLQNSNVTYSPTERSLSINNLTWNTYNAAPGRFAMRAAVEVTDFVVEDENGNKTILPDSMEDEASVYRNDPVVLSHPGANDTVIVSIENTQPITKPTGFTATGSAAVSNWEEKSENRSIFLRWNKDDNSSLAGYKITWFPSRDSSKTDSASLARRRSIVVGKTDHYTITIPDIVNDTTLFTENCNNAAGKDSLVYHYEITDTSYNVTDPLDPTKFNKVTEYDSLKIIDSVIVKRPNRLCPNSIDTAFYKANVFNVIITPVTINDSYEPKDTNWAPGRPKSMVKSNLEADSSDTVKNVILGVNRGNSVNNFTVAFKRDPLHSGPIDVPLNTGTVVNAAVAVSSRSQNKDPSKYGELWVVTRNDSTHSNAMPRGGAFNNYFTITDDDTLKTSVSFKPIEQSLECRDMFGSTCRKYKVDSLGKPITIRDSKGKEVDSVFESCTAGCIRPAGDTLCSDCDPNAANNKLPMNDPCNGHPDSLLYERTPFDIYTMYLYAVNNGRRTSPVPGINPGPVVYDSLQIRVVPPKPVLHGVSPSYILAGRDDTLSLAVSKLWLDTVAWTKNPAVRLQWFKKNGAKDSLILPLDGSRILKMTPSENNRNWKLETSADWEVRIPTKGVSIDTTGETKISVSVINRDQDVHLVPVQSVSNEFEVAYVYNPTEIECPNTYYDPDSANATYMMDWLGNYPSDYLSPGDSCYVRFTELHDFNPTHYSVKLLLDDDTIKNIDSFRVDYEGIHMKLPNTSVIMNSNRYRVITRLNSGAVDSCKGKNWGQYKYFSFVPKRSYDIVKVGNGFRIVLKDSTLKQYRYLDEVKYYIGSNSFVDGLPLTGYNHESDPPQIVNLSQSDWVTAIITRKSGGSEIIQKWIEVNTIPELVYTNGIAVPDSFCAEPGDTVIIRSPMQSFYERTQTIPYHCYRFGDGVSECHNNVIVFSSGSKGPLTIERWAETQSGQTYGYNKSLEGSRSYKFSIKKFEPKNIAGIIIPSQRILDATQRPVSGYPLLLRLDTTIVPNFDSLLSGQFHFRDAMLQPVPFEVEKIDMANRKADIWVKIPEINPGTGNNTVYLVAGSHNNNEKSVWSDYRAAWHFSGDTITDVTGNGFDITSINSSNIILGLINTSYSCSTSCSPLPVTQSSGISVSRSPIISQNDPGFTFTCWINLASIPSATVPIASFLNKSGREVCSFEVTPDSGLVFKIGSDSLKTIDGCIEEKTWLHVAVTYNWYATSGITTIYVNGLPVALKNRMNNAGAMESADTMLIAGHNFRGKIDEMRVSPQAFTESQVSLDYYSQRKLADFLSVPSGVTSVTSISRPDCRLVPGSKLGDYLSAGNDAWRISSLPVDLNGKTWFLMPWNERYSEVDTLVTVRLNGPAMVNVLFDSRYDTIPPFLRSYTNTGREIMVTEQGESGKTVGLRLYTKNISSASTLSFGGPMSGSISGGELPWAVLLDCVGDSGQIKVSAGPYPYVRTQKAAKGALLFSDREYQIDSLPAGYNDAVLVRMPEAFRFSDSSSLLKFSVNRSAVINLLLDTLYSSWPSYITNDSGWNIKNSRFTVGNKVFNVLSRTTQGKDSLTLGGPRMGGGKGNRSFYCLLVQPDNDTSLVKVLQPHGAVTGILDTGALPYVDSLWHVKSMPKEFKNMVLVRTRQSDYNSSDSVNLKLELKQSSWVYCAVDENQIEGPSFISDYDSLTGRWERTRFAIETSVNGTYNVFRKFLKNGIYGFAGAHYRGGAGNLYNYFMFANPTPIPDSIHGIDPGRIAKGDTISPWDTLPNHIIYLPPVIIGQPVIINPPYSNNCENQTFQVDRPVRIWLGIDPAFQTTGTFLHRDGWNRTDDIISLSGGLADRILWNKEFGPGTIEIPGTQCDYPQPGVMNPIIIVEFLQPRSNGLTSRNLKATGFGDERRGETENYIMRNLDVVYSWDTDLRSRSWVMNVETRSATAERGDTIIVLTPFIGDTILKINDTVIVRAGNQFSLPDLLPSLVAADSVKVNAIDLSAKGFVRIGINNRSSVSVNKAFDIILFEDRNGDFQYSRNIDKKLGTAVVNSIGPNQVLMYQINLNDTLSFPHRALLAFVDASDYVEESNEWNNVKSIGTTCDEYGREEFVDEEMTGGLGDSAIMRLRDSLTAGLPLLRDTTVFCYLRDFNGDSVIDSDDDLCIVYTYQNRLYAINAFTHDSLFPSIAINSLTGHKVHIDDFTGDRIPEIISGNALYDNTGSLIYDFSSTPSSGNPFPLSSLDFNTDGDRDSITYDTNDSCTVITSGRDSSTLFAYPLSRWTGRIDGVTVGTLSDVEKGTFHCYDVNASFPRYSVTSSDTVDLTARVANSGAYPVKGIVVRVYADTSGDSIGDGLKGRLEDGVIRVGECVVSEELSSQQYRDVRFEAKLPSNTKRVCFTVDEDNKYFECNENDNVIVLKVK